ncbi:MAG: helix-turn-helix domain-containing protein [Verrucomicrobiales bacterium]|nr:helix-turn-helix domain-containing protein [Verrucomicrobiales bacterium]
MSVSPPQPGEALRDLLEQRGISQARASAELGISRQHLNTIVNGHNPLSADLKLKLQSYLNVPPSHWTQLSENRRAFDQSSEGRQLIRQQTENHLIEEFELGNRGLLVNGEILKAAESGWLGIKPFTPSQLTPTGYWFTLALHGSLTRADDPAREPREEPVMLKLGLDLEPGMILHVLTHEQLQLPSRLEARVVTVGDAFCGAGLQLHASQHFEPGLKTSIGLQIHNTSGRTHHLHFRQPALKLQFRFLTLPPTPQADPPDQADTLDFST